MEKVKPGLLKTLIRLLGYAKPYKKRLVLAMAAMACVAAITTVPVLLTKKLADEVLPQKNVVLAWEIAGLVVLTFFLKGIFSYIQDYLMGYVGHRVIQDLRNALNRKIHELSLDFFSEEKTGQLMSRVTFDVPQVRPAITDTLSRLVRDGLTVIALIGVVLYLNWRLALLSFIIFPPALGVLYSFGKKLTRASKRSLESTGEITSVLQETLSNIRIVKAFGMEDYESAKFAKENATLTSVNIGYTRITSRSSPITEFIGAFGGAFFIGYGTLLYARGTVTLGDVTSFLAAVVILYKPVRGLSDLNNVVPIGVAAADRVFEILDTPPTIVDRPSASACLVFEKAITYKDVRFSYGGGKEVLQGINLEISKGKVVALVGSSGAGKTTLVDLLPRFYDVTGGAILIDGRDIREFTTASLRALMGIVTQETVLFNDTVRNNIAYGKMDALIEEIKVAAKAAYADGFIEAMPQGYDTLIGERGVKLSGGQRQRLAIARAILKNPAILIFDEATSALDSESEMLVQKAVEAVMAQRTTLVIAHRLSTIKKADNIIVLEHGRLVESGTHEQLLAGGGLYKKLYDMQFQS